MIKSAASAVFRVQQIVTNVKKMHLVREKIVFVDLHSPAGAVDGPCGFAYGLAMFIHFPILALISCMICGPSSRLRQQPT